jgi:KUP system potassium uptake protein
MATVRPGSKREASAALAGAYAFAIAGVMLITTIALFWVARDVWKWSPWLRFPLLGLFLIFDVSFLVATSTKIPEGAWLSLCIGFVVASVMWIWRKGRFILNERLQQTAMTWRQVSIARKSPAVAITATTGIYLSAFHDTVPQSLEEQIRVLHAMPEKIVIVNVVTTEKPYSRKKPEIKKHNDYVSFVAVYAGFMEIVNLPRALRSHALEGLIDEKDATYFVASRKFVNPPKESMNRVESFIFAAMHRNSALASDYFRLPANRVINFSVSMEK